jgi:hypothetical protein
MIPARSAREPSLGEADEQPMRMMLARRAALEWENRIMLGQA